MKIYRRKPFHLSLQDAIVVSIAVALVAIWLLLS
jgi:hypothetical protein